MIFDGHTHLFDFSDDTELFRERLKEANIDGAMVMSVPANSFSRKTDVKWKDRLAHVMEFTKHDKNWYPCFWIDPTEETALEQVEAACAAGIDAFKIICDHFHPEEGLEVYQAIANTGRSIIFHSGILWDGKPSAKYNRPLEWECLLQLKKLRFALAHVSWPWHDEHLAMYGKFLNAYSFDPDLGVEMFIDLTPGTPAIYREEVLHKIHFIGYDVADNILFGTDCSVPDYKVGWFNEWKERDNAIYQKLGVPTETVAKIYERNLMRFLGKVDVKVVKKIPKPDDASNVSY